MKNPILIGLSILCMMNCAKDPSSPVPAGKVIIGYKLLTGIISGDLPKGKSTYFVADSIVVAKNETLQIEPGVHIHFSDSARFIVRGRLASVGSQSEPILLTSFSKKWKGIIFEEADLKSELAFTTIENVENIYNDRRNESAVTVYRSSIALTHCILRNNYSDAGGGLFADSSDVTVQNSIFRDNRAISYGGALLLYHARCSLINNTIYGNNSVNFGAGMVLMDPDTTDAQNNIFYQNDCASGDPNIAVIQPSNAPRNASYNYYPVEHQDPQFVYTDDLHLTEHSICRNQGNPDAAFNDIDGSRNDQGAYGGPLGNW